jgi:hypothetical protein
LFPFTGLFSPWLSARFFLFLLPFAFSQPRKRHKPRGTENPTGLSGTRGARAQAAKRGKPKLPEAAERGFREAALPSLLSRDAMRLPLS